MTYTVSQEVSLVSLVKQEYLWWSQARPFWVPFRL